MYAQSTNNETCTRKHYYFFVVRHVGTARLDSLVSTRSTGSTKSNVSSRVETSQVEFGPLPAQGVDSWSAPLKCPRHTTPTTALTEVICCLNCGFCKTANNWKQAPAQDRPANAHMYMTLARLCGCQKVTEVLHFIIYNAYSVVSKFSPNIKQLTRKHQQMFILAMPSQHEIIRTTLLLISVGQRHK